MATITDSDVLSRIGGTPLVRLASLSTDDASYHAKLEGNNPFGVRQGQGGLLDDPGTPRSGAS